MKGKTIRFTILVFVFFIIFVCHSMAIEVPVEYDIFGDSEDALILAYQMINFETDVFLDLYDDEEVSDLFLHVYYQNVYNLGSSTGRWLDSENGTLRVSYLGDVSKLSIQQRQLYNKSKAIINKIIKYDMNDYDKIIAIWDYMAENCSYDYEASDFIRNNGDKLHNERFLHSNDAFGVLCEGRGVCEGFAKAFKLLCNECGIDCVVAIGYKNGGFHAWNIVNLDGYWYHIDCNGNKEDPYRRYFINSWECFEYMGYELCGDFVIGSDYYEYMQDVPARDYYTEKNLIANSAGECGQLLAMLWHNRKNDKQSFVVRYSLKDDEIDEFWVSFNGAMNYFNDKYNYVVLNDANYMYITAK